MPIPSSIARRNRSSRRGKSRTSNVTTTEMKTGLSIWSGQIQEEYLAQLKPWSREIKVFREMQDDVVIGALFESIKTPLISSPFEIAKGGDSDDDEKARQFVEDNLLNNPHFEWIQHVEEMLQFIDLGFAISEKVLEKDPKDGLLHIRDLMPIGPESLDRWGDPDEFGRVTSFQQRDKLGGVHSAPIEKLLHFTFRPRKRNPQGQGILRALYRPWFFKKNLETLEAIGVERDVGNAPVATLKEGVRYSESDITKLKDALEGFRMDEAMYVILPGGIELNAYGGGNKVYDVRAIISAWQHLIRQRFFADFLAFGSSNVGTQALAREMTTFFGLALRSIQNSMKAVWNRQLIPWLFEWNNWKLDKLPTIEWLRPGESNIQSLVQAYQMLVSSGLMDVNDEEFRARVRSQIGLKPITSPEEKVEVNLNPRRQLPQPKLMGNIKASEYPNFAEMEASELGDTLVNTVLNWISDIMAGVIDGTQDLKEAKRKVIAVENDIIGLERANKITGADRQRIIIFGRAAKKAIDVKNQEAWRFRHTSEAAKLMAMARLNLEEMQGSELVESIAEFFSHIVNQFLGDKLDAHQAKDEITAVQHDMFDRRESLTDTERLDVVRLATDAHARINKVTGPFGINRPNFDEFHGSELVDTILEFISTLVSSALNNKQDAGAVTNELAGLNLDARRMERAGKLSAEDRSIIQFHTQAGIRTVDNETFRRQDELDKMKAGLSSRPFSEKPILILDDEMEFSELLDSILGFFDAIIDMVTEGAMSAIEGIGEILAAKGQATNRLESEEERNDVLAAAAMAEDKVKSIRSI